MHAFKMAQLRSVNKSCLRWDALFGMLLSYAVIISLVFVIVGYLNCILYMHSNECCFMAWPFGEGNNICIDLQMSSLFSHVNNFGR